MKRLLRSMLICFTIIILGITNVFATDTVTSENIIYSMDFENGSFDPFTTRNSNDTTNLSIVNTESYSGNYSLLASNRTADWNGPMISISDKCIVGNEYLIKAKIMSPDASEIKVGYKYTDSNNETKYSTFGVYSGSGWQDVNVKFIIPSDRKDIYMYFQGGTTDIYIDDFFIGKATIEENIASLKDIYSEYFKVGGALGNKEFSAPATRELVLKHFDNITLTNELKPSNVLDYQATLLNGGNDNPQITLKNAKAILDFCRDNNLPVRGHTLLWHEQTPNWLFKENFAEDGEWVDKDTMLRRMENYIKNLFEALEEEYPEVDFYAWDVVNEAWLDNGTHRTGGEVETKYNGLLCSPWVQVFGDNSFIEYAFTYARKYAPKTTKLYYADFGEHVDKKRETIINMAIDLKNKGLLDGVSLQGHLAVDSPTIEVYRKVVDDYAKAGLNIMVSELDITLSGHTFEEQAEYYKELIKILVEYCDNVDAVVFWGMTDDFSWKASELPLLFNADYTAKPAFYALANLENKPRILGNVQVFGSPIVGNTIMANISGLDYNGATEGTIEYKWYRGDTLIESAQGSTYKITSEDVGKTIKVKVANSNNVGSVSSSPIIAQISLGSLIYSLDFENGSYAPFTTRNSNDTTILSIVDTNSYSGNYSLLASNRTDTWHGPMISLSDKCTMGNEYFIKAKVMSPTSEDIKLSYKYTDSNNETKYSTLGIYSGSGWQDVNIKFTMPLDRTNIFLYFHNEIKGSYTDIYIDDFIVEEISIEEDITSLKDVYKDYFKLGIAVTSEEIESNVTQDLVLKHFNSVTLINELKPDYILDYEKTKEVGGNDNPQIDLSAARPVLDFCRDNNLPVRGHTLLWHQQTPNWFFKENFDENGAWVDEATMLKRMENYIKNVFATLAEEYPTVRFYAWDVVNEVWLDNGSHRSPGARDDKTNGLLCSPWVQVFGDNSFVEYAFTYARKYAPKETELYYADFNGFVDAKRASIINMVKELQDKDLIDGYAFHGHLSVNTPAPAIYEAAILDFVEAGIDIQISEWDIKLAGATLEEQAEYYEKLMKIFIKYSDNINAVIFWGTTDDSGWAASESPNLFNADYTAKPAFYALANIHKKAKILGNVKIIGLPIIGETLAVDISGIDYNGEEKGTIEYEWYRGDTLITDAISNTYKITNGDVNNTIKVKVSNSNNTGTVASSETSVITLEGTVVLPEIPNVRGYVNPPMLAAGLKPVIYKNGGWNKTEYTNENWYDYENGVWANAVSDDESIYVWIPRFTYKIENEDIFIKFSEGKNDDTDDGYFRHPAFYLGGYNGGNPNSNLNFDGRNGERKELTGFWVQKYLASGDEYIQSVSNATPKLVTLNEAFENSLKMTSDDRYGFEQAGTYTHLMRASEWGALAYLTKAKGSANSVISTTGNIYGVCGVNSTTSQYVSAVVGEPENSGNMLREGYSDYCDVITLINENSEINNINRLENYFGFAITETNGIDSVPRLVPHITEGNHNNAYFVRGGTLGLFGYSSSDGEDKNIGFRTTIAIVPEESNKDIAFFDTETSLIEGDYLVISVDFTVDKEWKFIDNDGKDGITDDDLFKRYEIEENVISNANIDLECIYGAGEYIINDLNSTFIKLIKPVTDTTSGEGELKVESDLNQWFAPGKYTMAIRIGGKTEEGPVIAWIENLTAKIIVNGIALEDRDGNKIKISNIANNKILLNIYGEPGIHPIYAKLKTVPTKTNYALDEEFTNTSLLGGTLVLTWGNIESGPINLTIDNIKNKNITEEPGENKLVELIYNEVPVIQDEVEFRINVSDTPNLKVIGKVKPDGIGSILHGTGTYERIDEDYNEPLVANQYLGAYMFSHWESSSSIIKPSDSTAFNTEFTVPSKSKNISEHEITFTANYMEPIKLEVIDPQTEFIINDRFSFGNGKIQLTYINKVTNEMFIRTLKPTEVISTPVLNERLPVEGKFNVLVKLQNFENLEATYEIKVVKEKKILKVQVKYSGYGSISGNVIDRWNNEVLAIEVPHDNSNTIEKSVSVGDTVKLQVNPKEGYGFAGWSCETEGIILEGKEKEPAQFTMPEEDVTVIGVFAPIYTVRYKVYEKHEEMGYIEGDKVQNVLKDNYTSEVTAKPLDGYAFNGWVEDSKGATRSDGPIKEDETYNAKFIKVHKVTFYNGNEIFKEIFVLDGESGEIPDIPKDPENKGVFNGWMNSDLSQEIDLSVIHSDLSVYAKYEPRIYINVLEPEEENQIHAFIGVGQHITGEDSIINGTLQYIISDSPTDSGDIYFSEELDGFEFSGEDWTKSDNMYRSKEGLLPKEDASMYLIMSSSNSKEMIRFEYLLSASDDSQLGITVNGERVVGPDREFLNWQTFAKEVDVVDGKIKIGISYSKGENGLDDDYAAIRNICIARQWTSIPNNTTLKIPSLYSINYIHARGTGNDDGNTYTAVSDPINGKPLSDNEYIISYDANGGINPPVAQVKIHDVDLTLSDVKPTREGHTFLGWSVSNTATSAAYVPGGNFAENKNTVLYAVWIETKYVAEIGQYVYYPLELDRGTKFFYHNTGVGGNDQQYLLTDKYSKDEAPVFRIIDSSNGQIKLIPDADDIYSLSLAGERGFDGGKNCIADICKLYTTEYSESTSCITGEIFSILKESKFKTDYTGYYWSDGSNWGEGSWGEDATDGGKGRGWCIPYDDFSHWFWATGGTDSSDGVGTYGVLPVIVLKSDVVLSGKGTIDEPYSLYLPPVENTISVGDYVYYPVNTENTVSVADELAGSGTTQVFNMSDKYSAGVAPVFRVVDVNNDLVTITPGSDEELFSLSLNGEKGYKNGKNHIQKISELYATNISQTTVEMPKTMLHNLSSTVLGSIYTSKGYWTDGSDWGDGSYAEDATYGKRGELMNLTSGFGHWFYATGGTDSSDGIGTYKILPAITLRPGTTFTGAGTKEEPYTLTLPTYSITYDANEGSGAPGTQTKIRKEDLVLSSIAPTRAGFGFLGWSTDREATNVEYKIGETYSIDADLALYAVWGTIKDIPVGAYIEYAPTAEVATISNEYTGYNNGVGIQEFPIIKTGDDKTWYKIYANNEGQLDIISEESVADLHLGNAEGFVNAVYALNTLCSQYVNNKYADSAVSIGSTKEWIEGPIGKADIETSRNNSIGKIDIIEETGYPLTYAATKDLVDTYPYHDAYNTLIPRDSSYNLVDVLRSSGQVWMPSRRLEIIDTKAMFELRLINADGTTSYDDLYGDENGTAYLDYDSNAGVRPVVSLKSGLKLVGGSGTKADPYVLDFDSPVYIVTFNNNGGSGGVANKTVTFGSAYGTLPTLTKENYTFSGWYDAESGGNLITSESIVNIAENHTLYAVWDAIFPAFTYTDLNGNTLAENVGYKIENDGAQNWKIKFLQSGILTFNEDPGNVDVFVVGGGGAGGSDANLNFGGAGGGGGYTTTKTKVNLTTSTTYSITVGEGGTTGDGNPSSIKQNSITIASANGGKGAEDGINIATGGEGGSGGGRGADGISQLFAGVNGASDGQNLWGCGQSPGTTTREFGETTGTLYAGGGGGGGTTTGSYLGGSGGAGGGGDGGNANKAPEPGEANTGGGGGGGTNNYPGASGGSGIVIIRNAR